MNQRDVVQRKQSLPVQVVDVDIPPVPVVHVILAMVAAKLATVLLQHLKSARVLKYVLMAAILARLVPVHVISLSTSVENEEN